MEWTTCRRTCIGGCVSALVALALLTGSIGKASSGIYPLRPGANSQGAWDVGCVPDFLPGYVPVSDADARGRLEEEWECQVAQEPGLDLRRIFQGAQAGDVKAMFMVGGSPNFGGGQLGDGLAALQNLEFLVVQDTFLSPAAQQADVVLPRATFAEKSGTFTNLERRIQTVRPVISVKNSRVAPRVLDPLPASSENGCQGL